MFLAPVGVPKDIVQRVSQETSRALHAADLRVRFDSLGLDPVGSTPDQTGVFLQEEIAKWGKVITAASVKPE
jgi:tripartite-type tricarboxylate transporter receptor subunit TctC